MITEKPKAQESLLSNFAKEKAKTGNLRKEKWMAGGELFEWAERVAYNELWKQSEPVNNFV